MQFQKIKLKDIEVNKLNPRKSKYIDDIVLSMKKIGLLQPISVCRKGKKFEIIGGERRFLSAKKLGWVEIDCCIFKDLKTWRLMLAENLVRKKLNLLEEAEAVDSLLAREHGKNYLTTLNLPETVPKKEAILNDLASFNISIVRAKNLAQILFLGPDLKDKIRSSEIGLKGALALVKIKDVETRERIASGLTSRIPKIKKEAKEELVIRQNKNISTSTGFALEKVINNLTYVKNSLDLAAQNFKDVVAEEILEVHLDKIEEILSSLKHSKEKLNEFEASFKKELSKHINQLEKYDEIYKKFKK